MNKNKKRFEFRKNDRNPVLFCLKSMGEGRLLDFCLKALPNKPKNEIKSYLQHGCIAVNNVPTTQFDFILGKGDEVKIFKWQIESAKTNEKLINIIYEDEDFIAINKPSGLLSVASDKNHFENAFTYACQYLVHKDKKSRLFIIHRIDEDTSGVLVFCKNQKLKDILTKNWNSFITTRKYIGIIEGKLSKKEGKLVNYLKENNLNLMYVTEDVLNGKKCITNYKVLKENKAFSLLEINIETGRKNQIRVQFGHIGHFIIGDDKYGEPSNPLKRLGLHASLLEIVHPFTKKKITFKAPTPTIFHDLFKK